jgi:tetratricopeptide (TPR) repeat protein
VGAWIHCHARRYSHAHQLVRRARDLEPRFPLAAYIEAEILLAQQENAAALSVITPWRDAMRDFDYGLAILALTLARNGQRDEALRIAKDLEEQCSLGRATWSDVALVHLGLGSRDVALDFLRRAAGQKPFGGVMTAYLAVNPLFDSLRREPDFLDVLRMLRLDLYVRKDKSFTELEKS